MGTKPDFFEKVAGLKRGGESFAVATVVARRAPVSAHLGDRAIVYADGRMEGFVGGACSREIIRTQALEALRLRQARLVSIRPDASASSASDPEHVTVTMTCASEGAVDVYVEPMIPPRRLVVVGATPVAEALARMSRAMDYDVVRVVGGDELRDIEAHAAEMGIGVAAMESLQSALVHSAPDVAVIVASQGHYDEEALEVALRHDGSAYIGLVASKRRGATVLGYLEGRGVPGVSAVRNPAGVDLGARTPPEVALSILAEIVQLGSRRSSDPRTVTTQPAEATAIDPVCGMEVVIATAKHRAELDGTTYYFCCPHCRAHFLREPQAYLAARS